jgi:subtilisin family serine protease
VSTGPAVVEPASEPALTAGEVVDEANQAAADAAAGVGLVSVVSMAEGKPVITAVTPENAVPTALAADARGDVLAVEEAAIVTTSDPGTIETATSRPGGAAITSTNDPYYSSQWAFSVTPFEPAWACSTGTGVNVAVIDTGVLAGHPDLGGRVTAGWSKLNNGAAVVGDGGVDPNGHGTHVAGTIAATAGNGLGVLGVAPAATVIPVRVLDASGSGWDTDIANGMVWAVDHGANILSMSLGTTSASASLSAALDYATSHGVPVIAAAGNGGPGSAALYPAAFPGAIAVAAIDSTGTVASFSTTGAYVDVAAPGVGIWSTYSSSGAAAYARMNGTSMATPHVAGLAALVMSAKSGLTLAEVRSRLVDTATDAGDAGFDTSYGNGVINPSRAITG